MKLADLIPGGLADNKPDKLYNKDQVAKGTKVELEHVNSTNKAKEIAQDHLEEQRREGGVQNYYDKLLKMEGKSHEADGTAKKAAKSPKVHPVPKKHRDGHLIPDGVRVVATKKYKNPPRMKKAEDEEQSGEGQPEMDIDANSTAARPISLTGDRLEKEYDRAKDEADTLMMETTDPDTQEFVGEPEQAEKLDRLDNEIGGLAKLIRQVRYNIKDTLTDGQEKELGARMGPATADVVRPSTDPTAGDPEHAKAASSKAKVSPHGFEYIFPETNKSTNKLDGAPNLGATLGLNSQQMHPGGRSPDSQPLSNPGYTGPGEIKAAFLGPLLRALTGEDQVVQQQKATGKRLEANVPIYNKMIADRSKPKPAVPQTKNMFKPASEQTMDVYEKRAAEVLDQPSSLVDPKEIRVSFFFDGLADSLEKLGYYVARPTEFFVGMYEELRGHFEGPAKLASGVYPPHVVAACEAFEERMVKAADMSQLSAVNPLEAADQAQENALGVSPARQEKRQDIIDSLLPHAETISLDPDGKIKLKMPSPEASGVMDPQMMQQQQMAEMGGREQAQTANQMPLPTGEEAPAPMQGAQGGGEQPEISPEALLEAEQGMAGGGGGGGAGAPGGEPQEAPESPMGGGGIADEHALIQALMSSAQGSPGMMG